MKDILDFIGNHFIEIFFFFLVFGGSIAAFLNRILVLRHHQKIEGIRYKHRLQILAERRRIAEIENDAIKLLIADEALGEDFNRRLRVALDKARAETPPRQHVTRDPEIDEALAEEEARPAPRPSHRIRRHPS
jgi:hypothetical protein